MAEKRTSKCRVRRVVRSDQSPCDGDGKYGANCISRNKVHDDFGYGFPRYFVPTSQYLGNGGWGSKHDVITQGATKTWEVGGPGPEANDVNGFKLVVAVDTALATPPVLGRVFKLREPR